MNTINQAIQANVSPAVEIDVLLSSGSAGVEKVHTVTVLFDEDGNHKAGFDIVGKNSEQYRDAVRRTALASIKRANIKKQQIDGKTDAGAAQLYSIGERNSLEIAKAVVVGLPGFGANGLPLSVSGEVLDKMFAKFPAWVDKIHAALEVDANFLTI